MKNSIIFIFLYHHLNHSIILICRPIGISLNLLDSPGSQLSFDAFCVKICRLVT